MDVYGEFEWRGLIHAATEGARDALARHQTLRALIDWSHDLLSAGEQLLLRSEPW